MKNAALLFTAFALCACAGASYPTTVPISQAPTVFGQIGPLASAEGHRINNHGDRLHITFDDITEIQYLADPQFTNGPNILIGVVVDDGDIAPEEVSNRMSAASQKAYEWLKKATVVAPAPTVAVQVVQPVVPAVNINVQVAAPAAVPVIASCQKLLDCHTGLAELFCQAGGAQCQFKVEISGMDDAMCMSALPSVRLAVQPLAMGMPNFSMPLACQ